MPKRIDGKMQGFPLWVNLPKNEKMYKPKYRKLLSEYNPKYRLKDDFEIKIISGEIEGVMVSEKDSVVPIRRLDVKIQPNIKYEVKTTSKFMLAAFVFE